MARISTLRARRRARTPKGGGSNGGGPLAALTLTGHDLCRADAPPLTAVTTLITLASLRLSGTTGTVAAAVLALCAAASAGPLAWWRGA
ncbi:hypothetical protein [Streptomyces sp. NBC_01803]|uniref:hypothetical protein n=1 Tax=Streptomyces sp. NBC_01803 TaxID=2975946 RepID=UPI002DD9EE5E|nr:hypothetical protein [Streptomyces sp. NBC_01803]WSA44729.1 hypothetical protein OIE51_11255 [Streptomyces sp. NBC_01803]